MTVMTIKTDLEIFGGHWFDCEIEFNFEQGEPGTMIEPEIPDSVEVLEVVVYDEHKQEWATIRNFPPALEAELAQVVFDILKDRS